jgi:hypothetical protein
MIRAVASERGTDERCRLLPTGSARDVAFCVGQVLRGNHLPARPNAFWLGLTSFFCFGPFTGIPAVFVGAQALSDIRASRGRLVGRSTAWEGVVLGTIGSLIGIGIYWNLYWGPVHRL